MVKCKCIRCGREKIYRLAELKLSPKSCICCNSFGEYLIDNYLKKNNFKYVTQFSFPDLVGDNGHTRLRFDFCILNNKNEPIGFIEYNGQQHYSSWFYDKDEKDLEKRKRYDNKKFEYCKLHNYPLLILNKNSDLEKELDFFLKNFQ